MTNIFIHLILFICYRKRQKRTKIVDENVNEQVIGTEAVSSKVNAGTSSNEINGILPTLENIKVDVPSIANQQDSDIKPSLETKFEEKYILEAKFEEKYVLENKQVLQESLVLEHKPVLENQLILEENQIAESQKVSEDDLDVKDLQEKQDSKDDLEMKLELEESEDKEDVEVKLDSEDKNDIETSSNEFEEQNQLNDTMVSENSVVSDDYISIDEGNLGYIPEESMTLKIFDEDEEEIEKEKGRIFLNQIICYCLNKSK